MPNTTLGVHLPHPAILIVVAGEMTTVKEEVALMVTGVEHPEGVLESLGGQVVTTLDSQGKALVRQEMVEGLMAAGGMEITPRLTAQGQTTTNLMIGGARAEI